MLSEVEGLCALLEIFCFRQKFYFTLAIVFFQYSPDSSMLSVVLPSLMLLVDHCVHFPYLQRHSLFSKPGCIHGDSIVFATLLYWFSEFLLRFFFNVSMFWCYVSL